MERKTEETTFGSFVATNNRERDVQYPRMDHEEDARTTMAG